MASPLENTSLDQCNHGNVALVSSSGLHVDQRDIHGLSQRLKDLWSLLPLGQACSLVFGRKPGGTATMVGSNPRSRPSGFTSITDILC